MDLDVQNLSVCWSDSNTIVISLPVLRAIIAAHKAQIIKSGKITSSDSVWALIVSDTAFVSLSHLPAL